MILDFVSAGLKWREMILDSGPVAGVAFCGWQGVMRRNSRPIATIRNAARRKMQRAIQAVATRPQGEPGGPLNLLNHQHLDSASKRSTAKSRIMCCELSQGHCPGGAGCLFPGVGLAPVC